MGTDMRIWIGAVVTGWAVAAGAAEYLSPECVAVAPDGKTLYVTAATSGKLLVFDVAGCKVSGQWTLKTDPSGVAAAADGTVYVTGGGVGGKLYKVSADGKVLGEVVTGHTRANPGEGRRIGRGCPRARRSPAASICGGKRTRL
jgi:YVTN family beta-propeller protein